MSLRELPPDQAINPDKWRHLRYVPLVMLMVLVVIAAIVGYVVQRQLDAESAKGMAAASVESRLVDTANELPESCRPEISLPNQQPWLTSDPSSAEAVWAAHADELSNAYVEGEEGWVFWGDIQANNLSQAIGRRVLTNDEAARWNAYLSGVHDALAAKGIPFYVALTPAKWDVYPQHLPSWAQEIRGSGPLDQLLGSYPELPIIDLRTPLREASAEHPTYSRVNSHWTDYGAYLGWSRIAACINETAPELGGLSVPLLSGVSLLGGFNEFETYGFDNPSPDWSIPTFASELAPITLTTADGTTTVVEGSHRTGLEVLPAATTNDASPSAASALVLRDSFGSSMSVYLQQSFRQTWQVRHNFDFGPDQVPDVVAMAGEHDPDVVILQLAQRHLNFPPSM